MSGQSQKRIGAEEYELLKTISKKSFGRDLRCRAGRFAHTQTEMFAP